MASNKSKGVAIFRVVSGNFLEMYDFMVYGFYATAIAKTFFPGDNPFASLMLSLATLRRLPDAAAGCGVPGRLHRSPARRGA